MERPDKVVILVHTSDMQIVYEGRELDTYGAAERGELIASEIIEVLESTLDTVRAYRDAGIEQLPQPGQYPHRDQENDI